MGRRIELDAIEVWSGTGCRFVAKLGAGRNRGNGRASGVELLSELARTLHDIPLAGHALPFEDNAGELTADQCRMQIGVTLLRRVGVVRVGARE